MSSASHPADKTTARNEVLGRIRRALPPVEPAAAADFARIARDYRRTGALNAAQRLELLIDRLVDYDTEILHAASERELPQAVALALQHAGETKVLAPAAFPTPWLPSGIEIIRDQTQPALEIEGIPAVVTTCEAAVAATGTILLVHHEAQGRRIATLLPDHHICLIRHDQIYELLPEALRAIHASATAPITTISGPSATSDIEMTRIRGVHGPRRLTAILYSA
jgi:L-lactate dehydrogenase complex protein LldG